MPRRRSPKRKKLTGPIHGRIAEFREAKGMSQQDLADKLEVDKTAVSHWENGVARPDLGRLSALAAALDVTLDDLLNGEIAA